MTLNERKIFAFITSLFFSHGNRISSKILVILFVNLITWEVSGTSDQRLPNYLSEEAKGQSRNQTAFHPQHIHP